MIKNIKKTLLLGLTSTLMLGGLLSSGCTPVHNDVDAFLIYPRPATIAAPYTLGPGDKFKIDSENIEEITGSYTVAPNGIITLPYLKRVYVAGMTDAQIEEMLKSRLMSIYSRVDVTVTITEFTSKYFYVFGEVNGGRIQYKGGETILDVLAENEPGQLAESTRIYIMRPSPDGRSVKAMTVDWEAIKTRAALHRNALIAPGDIIYVPPSGFVLTARTIEHILLPLAPISQVVQAPLTIYGLGTGYNTEFAGSVATPSYQIDSE